jgi:hypothetical protein
LSRSLELLAEFTLDAWLLAKFGPQAGVAMLDGRTWERAISGLLYRPGFTRRQGPGSLTLFGSPSASGVNHEIDGAADGWRGTVIVESKAIGGGISKGDVALFHYKVMDFYQKKVPIAATEKWWPILCSTTSSTMSARAAAINLGVSVCDPGRIPLPVLVRAASRPAADMYLPEALLQEIVRLGERALLPLQGRWLYRADTGEIRFNPRHWKDTDISDLLWLEDELSECLLGLYAKHRAGLLEDRAQDLIWQARKTA